MLSFPAMLKWMHDTNTQEQAEESVPQQPTRKTTSLKNTILVIHHRKTLFLYLENEIPEILKIVVIYKTQEGGIRPNPGPLKLFYIWRQHLAQLLSSSSQAQTFDPPAPVSESIRVTGICRDNQLCISFKMQGINSKLSTNFSAESPTMDTTQ